jgi:glycosyltransferase involved in cell wall biosynthesis
VDLAIRAAAALARGGPALPLTIVGDGPERLALEREATANPALSVQFLGALPRAAVVAELERADAMLFTARDEGFGLAAVEALMTGVPVVACRDGGGVVSALGRYGGGFVVAGMPDDLAGALRGALTDRAREAARRAGALWRSELAPERVAARFEEWYAEALAR